MFSRVEVILKDSLQDPKGESLLTKIRKWNPTLAAKIQNIRSVEIFWVQFEGSKSEFETAAKTIWFDPVLNQSTWPASDWLVEREYHPGMTDNLGQTGLEALQIVTQQELPQTQVRSGQAYLFSGTLQKQEVQKITEVFISNALIHSHRLLSKDEFKDYPRLSADMIAQKFVVPAATLQKAQTIFLAAMSDDQLVQFSRDNLLSLTLSEMKAIQAYFASEKRDPTDVEVEVLAQTWSEHCKHKIFAANVSYTEVAASGGAKIPGHIPGLFKTTIAGTTSELPKDWLLSVFKDNAGIVAFSDDDAVCIKVETHNSPSALDPFGGAITGIVGVNRDILGCGYGAKPIFNTDVFCVGPLDRTENLPAGIIPPAQLLEGVRSGVEHGGNQSGIPTVNGALYFDPSFIGKPLIFCGSGGVMPRKIGEKLCAEKVIHDHDLICMVGGRIGRDGIHGATFSSLEMTESIPASVVQLGDPITQRRMTDFLIEARDQNLYRCITDNGAGGLSSSVGEMAEIAGGARMDVSLAKTKMPGLKPFELVISESQERMSVAVPPANRQAFLELAKHRGVEVSVLGEFTTSGRFEIFYGADYKVADLSLQFLHKGCPTLQLKAHWKKSAASAAALTPKDPDYFVTLKKLLQRPNIRSKENLIRQYDHEVQGRSVIKPLQTANGRSTPNDASVSALSYQNQVGVVVGCGLNPRLSLVDPYLMAQAAVDEAIRNVLAVGAEFSLGPDTVLSLIDNFCWPDPVEDAEKMAALVRTCYGLRDACLALKTPLISGKDSMKNDYKGVQDGKPVKVSVLPTLLVTAMGRMKDYRKARSAEFKAAGDVVYRLGPAANGLQQSEWQAVKNAGGELPIAAVQWSKALPVYEWLGSDESFQYLKSVHDVSDGGLLVAAAESAFTKNLGLRWQDLDLADAGFSFGEGLHQFVVSVAKQKAAEVEALWLRKNISFLALGEVITEPVWISGSQKVTVDELYQSWSGDSL